METLNNLNKLISQFKGLADEAKKNAEESIKRLDAKDRIKYSELMNRAKSGNLSYEELLKEVRNA